MIWLEVRCLVLVVLLAWTMRRMQLSRWRLGVDSPSLPLLLDHGVVAIIQPRLLLEHNDERNS